MEVSDGRGNGCLVSARATAAGLVVDVYNAGPAVEVRAPASPVLVDVLDMLRGMDDAWWHLTCMEADALARLLAVNGRREVAAHALLAHIEDDDGGDPHAPILAAVPSEREAAAFAYLDALLTPETKEAHL